MCISDFHMKNINFLFSHIHMYSGFSVIDIMKNRINLLIMNKCVVIWQGVRQGFCQGFSQVFKQVFRQSLDKGSGNDPGKDTG